MSGFAPPVLRGVLKWLYTSEPRRLKFPLMKVRGSLAAGSSSDITPKRVDIQTCIISC
jgi:hypothetical protein